ncbi:hypothetical protein DPMN_145208 [Dreissena polymorpha]|uniref:Fibrinogen C-terminal domain-containing protein n=1 Tax=Dreissena polymorpha TaxID=45954 RepID=A0A9D4J0T4_DREPO|nr:hypothetical protein DPMN_145208 [Dreissena polymorpha]
MAGEIAPAIRLKHKAVTLTNAKLTDSGAHGLHGLYIAPALRRKHKAVTLTNAKLMDSGAHGLNGLYVHLTVTRHGLELATIQHRYMAGEIAMALPRKPKVVTHLHVKIAMVKMKDCLELLSSGAALLSGVYTITTPLNHTKIQVYCDMVTDGGGGWTVFQRRFNGSVDFYRNFSEYENGFGQKDGEHWLGLKYIQEITSSGDYQVRVDFKRWNGAKGYDVYKNFSLQPGTDYTMNIGSRLKSLDVSANSLIGNPWYSPAGCAFSTYDHDVDKGYDRNCAVLCRGGWWYNGCHDGINPNGRYGRPQSPSTEYMLYGSFDALAAITMMFKQT